MIEKILERLREKKDKWLDAWRDASITDDAEDCFYADGMSEAFLEAMKIVQEVSKEYEACEVMRSNCEVANEYDWIPVEVAMPTEEGWYRVTCDDKKYWKTPMVRDLYFYPRIKCFVDNIRRSEHPYEDIKKFDWTEVVTAWKPVEAPYQKGE